MCVCLFECVWGQRIKNGVEIWSKTINRLCVLMWLSSCGCSLSAENAEWWVQWEQDQWTTERGERVGKDEWRQSEWWPAFLDVRIRRRENVGWCVLHAEKVRAYVLHCFHMQMSQCYYSLFTSFGVCLFMGIYSTGLKLWCHITPSLAAMLEARSCAGMLCVWRFFWEHWLYINVNESFILLGTKHLNNDHHCFDITMHCVTYLATLPRNMH